MRGWCRPTIWTPPGLRWSSRWRPRPGDGWLVATRRPSLPGPAASVYRCLIPTALIGARFRPPAGGNRAEPVGRRRQPVPGLAAGRDDRLVVRPDAMAELVLPQVLPHVLDRVQLGCVGGQRQEGEGLGDGEAAG